MVIKGMDKNARDYIVRQWKECGLINRIPGHQSSLSNIIREMPSKARDHESVLHRTLLKEEKAIAIEIPLWDNNRKITGHSDLILIEDNKGKENIVICDYKTGSEDNFFKYIPQVALYGKMIEKLIPIADITCYIYNEKGEWRFSPNLLNEATQEVKKRNLPFNWKELID